MKIKKSFFDYKLINYRLFFWYRIISIASENDDVFEKTISLSFHLLSWMQWKDMWFSDFLTERFDVINIV
jgi:hypothetical protein